jgi:hypothetical protein
LLPVIAAIGATLIPALIYMRAVNLLEEPALEISWPVSFATDIAISYFVARIIFRLHAAVPFLLLLAIASDALGFLALALFYPTGDLHLAAGTLIMAGAMAIAFGLRRARVRSFWPYLLGAGSVSWFALYWGGLHPALALMPIVPFLPHAARDPGFFVDARPTDRDALSQLRSGGISRPGGAAFLRSQRGRAPSRAGARNAGILIAVFSASRRHSRLRWGRPRRRPAPAAPVGWRELIVGTHRRNRFQYRAVLRRVLPPVSCSETGMGRF